MNNEGSTGVEKSAEDYWYDHSHHASQTITQANFKQAIRRCQKETGEKYIAALKELIEISEEYTRIRSVKAKYSPDHMEEWDRIKSIIDRAKALQKE